MERRQFLQVPGPTNVPDRVLRALSQPMINHRGPEFAQLLKECLDGLKEIFRTRNDILLFPSSGSGGQEAAIVNTLSPGDRVLVAVQGVFSERLAKIAASYGAQIERIDFEWGRAADPEAILDRLSKDSQIKAVLMSHNETSTGVTNDVQVVGSGLRSLGHPAVLIVDGVSSVGCIPLETDAWGVDIAITASQKGLMLPAGMAFLSVSEKAWRAHGKAAMPRWYWDFSQLKKALAAGRTPYTPVLTILFGLRESLKMLREEGLEEVFRRHRRLARAMRQGVRAMGMSVLPDENCASPTVTAINLPSVIEWKALSGLLRERYAVVLGGGLGKLEGKIFRIGHLGHLGDAEIIAVLGSLEMALAEMGFPVDLGGGVSAAERELLSRTS